MTAHRLVPDAPSMMVLFIEDRGTLELQLRLTRA